MPNGLITFFIEHGFDVQRVKPSTPDAIIASQAKSEQRIIVTFDSDFSNILEYPPKEYCGIIRINVKPPLLPFIINSLQLVFAQYIYQENFIGKLIIVHNNRFRVWDDNID